MPTPEQNNSLQENKEQLLEKPKIKKQKLQSLYDNALRESEEGVKISIASLLSGGGFSCQLPEDLSEMRLDRADFTGATFSPSTNFYGTSLRDSDLTGANLAESFLASADLTKANLTKANLEGSTLKEIKMQDAIMAETNLAGAWLFKINLMNVNLECANLIGATIDIIENSTMYHTNLKDAIIIGAIIKTVLDEGKRTRKDINLKDAISGSPEALKYLNRKTIEQAVNDAEQFKYSILKGTYTPEYLKIVNNTLHYLEPTTSKLEVKLIRRIIENSKAREKPTQIVENPLAESLADSIGNQTHSNNGHVR
ncbi:MAG: pipB2 [Rickettsiaceae bacterium]|jgi:uncharacterized protein YjbI with pentapeptide repeats|nr:pipB2 [Rickettsiaceae bacterium]